MGGFAAGVVAVDSGTLVVVAVAVVLQIRHGSWEEDEYQANGQAERISAEWPSHWLPFPVHT